MSGYLKASNPWNPGYALPSSVQAEPFARGVYVSKGARRKTISQFQPSEFTGLGGLGSLGGSSIAGSSIAGSSLAGSSIGGSSLAGKGTPSSGDPIARFGKDGAALVIRQTMKAPKAQRKAVLKSILDAVDPSMYDDVCEKADALKTKGYDAKAALEKAIAASLANRFLKQLGDLGRGGGAPTSGPLGLCGAGTARALAGLSGFWNDVYKYSGAKGVVSGAEYVGNHAGGALKGLGHLVCKAANSGGLTAVAGSVGGPAAGAGASIAGSLCPKGQVAVMEPPPNSGSSMLPYLLIGGAGLAAILLLK